MRFWIDTEYDDSRERVELISLAAVSEDGREFYAVSTEFDPQAVKSWVKENVLSKLPPRTSNKWMTLDQMKTRFIAFVGTEPAEFWSIFPTYDWYLVTWNFLRGWDHLPGNWPFECYDLGQWAFHLGVDLPPHQDPSIHDALVDARHHRDVYRFLASEQAKRGQSARGT